MVDMSQFVAPKSDQLNADDLIAGPRTITVTRVSANEGSPEQPISIFFEGDAGKPYKPCKSMRRVMIAVWGADAGKYAGRSMTIYRDPSVSFGGMQVGGIRISHMSGISEKKTMALTATRASRKPYTVHPLTEPPKDDPAAKWANAYVAKLATLTDLAAVESFEAEKSVKLAELQGARPELHATVTAALAARTAELSPGGSFDDDLTGPDDDNPPGAETNDAATEKTAAEDAVEKIKAQLLAASDADAVERIIKDAEQHLPFLGDELATGLEIAFDRARQRVAKAPAEAGAAK